MKEESINRPSVTIVVVPRDRFSAARRSLESIYENSDIPFHLVYVDSRSPRGLRLHLERLAKKRSFELIRSDRYLSPNQARNLGLSRVKTPYVVFIDNDVVVKGGWLGPLVNCAEETGAWMVSPLLCEGPSLHQVIHSLGGECRLEDVREDGVVTRRMHDKMLFHKERVDDAAAQLFRKEVELAEFHCALVSMDAVRKLGALDEKLLSTREHVDFSLAVRKAGGSIYLEPASIVTYGVERHIRMTDIPYYMLRWSDDWTEKSLRHFSAKWGIDGEGYVENYLRRIKARRKKWVIDPLVRRWTFGRGSLSLENLLLKIDRRLNRYMALSHEKNRVEFSTNQ